MMNDLDILFCVPSKGRGDSCSTHKVLPSCKYFVCKEEAEEYIQRAGSERVEIVPDGIQVKPVGKCRTLNYILDKYKTNKNVILFSDDDIMKITRPDFNNLKNNKGLEVSENELKEVIRKVKRIADIIGAKIGGFSAITSFDCLQMGLSNRFKLSEKMYIDGKCFIIWEDDGTRFDEELFLKEDIDFNCESLKKNRRTLSVPFVCFSGKALTNKGGVVDYRSVEGELEQGAKMVRKHPGMLFVRSSNKGNGVRKKAIQFGLR